MDESCRGYINDGMGTGLNPGVDDPVVAYSAQEIDQKALVMRLMISRRTQ